MRLIDADKIDNLNKYNFGVTMLNSDEYVKVSDLENLETAYSVANVVEELKERTYFLKYCTKYGNKNAKQQDKSYDTMMMYEVADLVDDLIEIVKNGGVSDDVCEWKSASDGELIQNPHTKRLYSNEPSMQNVYCNTCGKKIKIVGDCCRYRDNRTYLDIIYELIKEDILESDCAKEMESD